MPITGTNLLNYASAVDAMSYSPATTISPGANRLLLMAVESSQSSGAPPEPAAVGCGVVWVVEETRTFPGTPTRRLTVLRAMGSPVSDTVTVSFGVATQTGCSIQVNEFDGVDTSGTNGSGAVRQSEANNASSTSGSVTLAAFGSASNATFGAFVHQANEVTNPGSGFTELADISHGSPNAGLQTEWRADNDTSVDASWATNTAWAGIALEIVAAAGGTVYNQNLAGSTTPAASLAKSSTKLLLSTTTPTASLLGSSTKIFEANLPSSGALNKSETKVLSGSLDFSGALAKTTLRLIGGSTAPSGIVSNLSVILKFLSGSTTPFGALVHGASKTFGGSSAPLGSTTKVTRKTFESTLTSLGLVTKAASKSFAGSTAPIGTTSKSLFKVLDGLLTPEGSRRSTLLQALAGTISPSGALTNTGEQVATATPLVYVHHVYIVPSSHAVYLVPQAHNVYRPPSAHGIVG